MTIHNLVILIGPAASGKTTLAEYMELNGFNKIVTSTTRTKRVGEVDGVQYHFATIAEFQSWVRAGKLIEYNQYCGNYYGVNGETFLTEIYSATANGKSSVLITDIHGVSKVKTWLWENNITNVKCFTAFCYVPPSVQKERLIERISSEISNLNGAPLDRSHLNTFFDRAHTSMVEYTWMQNPLVDILVCCDTPESNHQNLQKLNDLLGR